MSKALQVTLPLTGQLEDNIWQFILRVHQHLQFFELPEERETAKLFDRYEVVDPDLGVPLAQVKYKYLLIFFIFLKQL